MADGLEVLRTYCEGTEKSLPTVIDRFSPDAALQQAHVDARTRSEEDFFGSFVAMAPDQSKPVFLPKGEINELIHAVDIQRLKPDILLSFGCSLIKEPLLSASGGRFVNIHLGLSPYYRGSGTNFWPLVNQEPEFVGVTFMHIDAGVGTGEIVHQMRARIYSGDNPHQIGNRLISDMVRGAIEIVLKFDELIPLVPLPEPERIRVCKRKDFSPKSVHLLYEAFENGLIERYLREREYREGRSPILCNPTFQETAGV